jgi:uncharacterized membrane protein
MSARAAAAAADAEKKAAALAAAAKQAAIAAAAEEQARELKAKIDAAAGAINALTLHFRTEKQFFRVTRGVLFLFARTCLLVLLVCHNGYAAEAKRKKAEEETEFSGSWTLRKIMRDKALNGGGMSMQDVVSMERMCAV